MPLIAPAELLSRHGRTFADQAGITLRDEPAPLFQLVVLTQLSSVRIGAEVAARAAGELFAAGWRTPERLRASTSRQRIDALGRGGYRRYDISTAAHLAELAAHVLDEVGGDLRAWRPTSYDDVPGLERRLRTLPRIGPTGASIFCREVQAVWPEVRPYVDARSRRAAAALGYPSDPQELAALVPTERFAELTSALVRWSLTPDARAEARRQRLNPSTSGRRSSRG